MTQLTMIGLGAMGSALARAFLGAGTKLTVWNRTPEKMTPLVEAGAEGAEELRAALTASPVVVICIDNYAVTRALLEEGGLIEELDGRTVVQVSTGTPGEARAAEAWFTEHGAAYLDGALLPYPSGIGDADAQILFAGPEETFSACQPLLACLGGDLRYLGDNIAAAAVMDMALLTRDLGIYLGAVHGMSLCVSEGVELETFSSLFAEDHPAKALIETARAESYAEADATVDVWLGAIEKIQGQARDRGINSDLPDLAASFFKRASAMGFGDEDTAAIFKALRAEDA